MSFVNAKNLSSPLILFYKGESSTITSHPGKKGYLIDEIYNWDFERLEYVHDYIQWLFPLAERSAFNLDAPVLTDEDIECFKNDEDLKTNVLKSFKLMMKFYGFDCDDSRGSVSLKKSNNFQERSKNWLTIKNHNHLRITRILKSLTLLGLNRYALAFFNILNELYQDYKQEISTCSYNYWKEAAQISIDR
ncbi:opioid growth factor receptor-related protein [Gloeothece verrucosa]|uniref:Opioid growth factor receptor (OGFr) conserved region n=1 Tax=Gloeothece verrucosa (strain PCC 7822) TaxID=497965 RepID=E0UF76_GLOV7|nr:opioid growth factor receptor-related protein [Gloeothece verrucosa]ADN15447.1 Opioid growth factor receptor (OGFr) conserved region [Gloeothece verrucosa PCC 7822]